MKMRQNVISPQRVCVYALLSFTSLHFGIDKCEGWVWLGGDKIVDRISTDKYPGSRSGASTWQDVSRNLTWMFGGQGFSDMPYGKPQLQNDLWQFNPEAKNTTNLFARQGPEEKSSDLQLKSWPGSRRHASMCGLSGMFILYGGLGENDEALGDMWIYDIEAKHWTQIFKIGPGPRGHPGVWCFGSFMYVFGGVGNNSQILNDMWKFSLLSLEWTMLHPSTNTWKSNLPEARNGPATWISDGTFYMFGGNTATSFSYSVQLTKGFGSDLWRYFSCNSTWEYVSGPSKISIEEVHIYRKMDVNIPSPRIGAGSWNDASGNLWLFGGAGINVHDDAANEQSQVLSDLWRFSLKRKSWVFQGGSTESDQAGIYPTLGEETEDSMPGGRTEMMVFPGSNGKIYIFGGVGHDSRKVGGFLNDLWCIDVDTVLAEKYRISTLSVLLFFGFCIGTLVLILILGLWGRPFKGFDSQNKARMLGGFEHQYRQLDNDAGF